MQRTRRMIDTAACLTGLAALACLPCCAIPLAGPLLAWLGTSALAAAVGGYTVAAGVLVLGAVAYLLARRTSTRCSASGSCHCAATRQSSPTRTGATL